MNTFGTIRAVGAGALLALALSACSHDKPVPVPHPVTAKTPCGGLTFGGFPKLTPPVKLSYFVCKPQGFALQFNPTSKTSLWTTEHITAQAISAPPIAYAKDVRADPDLPEGTRNELYDFERQGWAMWQMAPAKDFGQNRVAISHSFYLSNMLPVPAANRSGILAWLEGNIRLWAQQYGELYVVTGPIYLNGEPAAWIGGPPPRKQGVVHRRYTTSDDPRHPHKDKMGVPNYVFKVIYAPKIHQAVAFVIPNAQVAPSNALPQYATNVATVERYTHIEFFPELPANERQALVNTVSAPAWILH